MRMILVLVGMITITSCAKSQISPGKWIEKENENRILSIMEEDGKFWISQFQSEFEIINPESSPYVQMRDRKMPITFAKDGATLYFLSSEYIPLEESKKGQFLGNWKSLSEDIQFLVQLDSNIELNWDIIKESERPVRFYPKRTDKGVHFTVGQDTLSYEIKDGLLIDQNGKKYKKESS